jgi:hypothetical protein
MYRESSFLLQKDYRVHGAVAEEILNPRYASLKNLTLDDFTLDSRRTELADALLHRGAANVSDTLATKILLGTLGCTPAYDRFFIAGLKKYGLKFSYLNKTNFSEAHRRAARRRERRQGHRVLPRCAARLARLDRGHRGAKRCRSADAVARLGVRASQAGAGEGGLGKRIFVIAVQTGIQCRRECPSWMPAFAGMTTEQTTWSFRAQSSHVYAFHEVRSDDLLRRAVGAARHGKIEAPGSHRP